MSLINIQNLTFSYDGEPPIFDKSHSRLTPLGKQA